MFLLNLLEMNQTTVDRNSIEHCDTCDKIHHNESFTTSYVRDTDKRAHTLLHLFVMIKR